MDCFPCDHHKVTHAPVAYLLVPKSHRQSQLCAQRCSLIPFLPKYVQRMFLLKSEMPDFMLWTIFILLWLQNRKTAYIFWKNPLQKNTMCMEGRHCSCFISVPCTGGSWDGALQPADCSFSLIDYPTEIQSPWQTGQRTTMFEHITAHFEKSGVQTVVFQSTVIWLQSC